MSVLIILELTTNPANNKDLKEFLRSELSHTRGFNNTGV